MLSAILGREITSVELGNNPILEKDLSDSKVGVLDIKAKIDEKVDVDIEMQIVDKNVNISLTDKLEFYILELPKFEKYKDKENNFQIENGLILLKIRGMIK